ncbi:energy transducer TonB [Candidatus Omnitrophota bacterium]
MFRERIFQVTLIVSLIAHGVILTQNSSFNVFAQRKKDNKLQISYVKPPKEKLRPEKSTKREPLLKIPSNISAGRKLLPKPAEEGDLAGRDKKIRRALAQIKKPALAKPDIIAVKKKITLPPIGTNKIKNVSYLNYYQIVREKIKRAAYQNYTRTETGEVFLSFIISDDGSCNQVRLVEEKSSRSAYLQQTALRSIRDASPFPYFPKGLDYPQLSFNVVISFEVE